MSSNTSCTQPKSLNNKEPKLQVSKNIQFDCSCYAHYCTLLQVGCKLMCTVNTAAHQHFQASHTFTLPYCTAGQYISVFHTKWTNNGKPQSLETCIMQVPCKELPALPFEGSCFIVHRLADLAIAQANIIKSTWYLKRAMAAHGA